MVPKLAMRLMGSPDLLPLSNVSGQRSVNFVTCHDGFTLYDLVAYDEKHNEANAKGNKDGTDSNYSWNCGEKALPTVLRFSVSVSSRQRIC
jgi:glycogen operon protein